MKANLLWLLAISSSSFLEVDARLISCFTNQFLLETCSYSEEDTTQRHSILLSMFWKFAHSVLIYGRDHIATVTFLIISNDVSGKQLRSIVLIIPLYSSLYSVCITYLGSNCLFLINILNTW